MRLRIGVAALSAMTCVLSLHAQTKAAPVPLPRTEIHELASTINGQSYRISASLPESYANDAATRFPVIYVTDADWVFGITTQTQYLLQIGGMTPDAIVVGIARTGADDKNTVGISRSFDLSPTRDTAEEALYRRRYGRDTPTGGGDAFLRVMTREIIPDVERRYRATNDRTYVGYSLGGVLGVYALFHSPDTFKRMVLVSPSLWWNDGVAAKWEEEYAATHKSLAVRLFMSDGELETASMAGTMKKLEEALKRRKYPDLDLHTRIFEGEIHLSTFPVAVTRGLRTVFADAAKP